MVDLPTTEIIEPIIVIEKLLLVDKEFLLKIIRMKIMTFKMLSSQDDIKFFFSFINSLLHLTLILIIIIDYFFFFYVCSATI